MLGHLALLERDLDRAEALLEQSQTLLERSGDEGQRSALLTLLGHVALGRGDQARAVNLWRESWVWYEKTGMGVHLPLLLEGMARNLVDQEGTERGDAAELALRLDGGLEALRSSMGLALHLIAPDLYTQAVGRARQTLGDEEAAAVRAAGRSAPLEHSIADALTYLGARRTGM